jgi:hypothetical protein
MEMTVVAQGPVDALVSREDTYQMPPHGWTCFHCGETFTTVGAARIHFGETPAARPGCLEKVSIGAERGLLMALRKAEQRIAKYMEEDTDLHRSLYRMQSQHSDALRDAEEAGYERGARRHGPDG